MKFDLKLKGMNREIWKTKFWLEENIKYPCPSCEQGVLGLEREIQKEKERKTPSFADYSEEADYMERIYEHGTRYVFTSILHCNNQNCCQAVTVCGTLFDGVFDFDKWRAKNQRDWFDEFCPYYFYPNLRMFKFPDTLPQKIKEEIDLSFANYFIDTKSAANKIRRAIELLMDVLGARKFKYVVDRTSGNRRKHFFKTLHSRIEALEINKKTTSKLLMGLKVLGNDGSHASELEITHEDLLDAYEVLEFVIEKEITKRHNVVLQLANNLANRS